MKDIKKMLKAQAKNVLPDEKLKENIKHELGYDAGTADAPVLARADGGTEEKKGKQKVMIPLVALAAILLVLAIVLPLVLPGTVSPLPLPGGNKFADITNADSFYAYGAASVGSILASEGETSSVRAMTDESAREEKHIETVNRYLALVEGLLSEDSIEATAVAGDYGYSFGMKIGYTDLLGEAAHYTLYFDKIFLSAEQEMDEKEEEYAIEGVLEAEGRTYPVRGNYETESEMDETEDELYFRAYLDEESNSFLEITQEYEAEQEERTASRKSNANTSIPAMKTESASSAPPSNMSRRRASSNSNSPSSRKTCATNSSSRARAAMERRCFLPKGSSRARTSALSSISARAAITTSLMTAALPTTTATTTITTMTIGTTMTMMTMMTMTTARGAPAAPHRCDQLRSFDRMLRHC